VALNATEQGLANSFAKTQDQPPSVDELTVTGVRPPVTPTVPPVLAALPVAAVPALTSIPGARPTDLNTTPPDTSEFNTTPPDTSGLNTSKGGVLGTGLSATQIANLVKSGVSLSGLLGGLGSALGSALGGSSSGSSGTANQTLNPVFSGGLPPPTSMYQNLGQVPVTGVNWNRYGMGPEQAFFNYAQSPAITAQQQALQAQQQAQQQAQPPDRDYGLVPLPSLQAAKGGSIRTNLAVARPPEREDFAVQGPGTGRSDSIPAKLSDGEYVVDAETVALLGDGSSKAGANKLDEFRANIRKQKGKQLAKGRFSAKAKAPGAYLSGGRV
jgi:hypothetical protein